MRTYDHDIGNLSCKLYILDDFGINRIEINSSAGGIIVAKSVEISVKSVCPGSPVMGISVIEDGDLDPVYLSDDKCGGVVHINRLKLEVVESRTVVLADTVFIQPV